MSVDREWHSKTLCKITRMLKKNGHQVYSECMFKNGDIIELEGKTLNDISNKIGLLLCIGEKSDPTQLSKPDIIVIEDDRVKYIIEVEEATNPKEMAGIIVASRNATNGYINGRGLDGIPFKIKDTKLYIIIPSSELPLKTKVVIDDVLGESFDKIGYLSEILIIPFDEFVVMTKEL